MFADRDDEKDGAWTSGFKWGVMVGIVLTLALLFSTSLRSKEILISFDGSGHIYKWRDTVTFAKKNNVKFTYFVSAPYFVSEAQEKEHPYWGIKTFGYTPIVFRNAKLATHIPSRVRWMNYAIENGNEIASHLVGHYGKEGVNFTYDQWVKEMEYFKWAMETAGFDYSHIKGVRAPNLSVNEDYYKVIRKMGFEWDSSTVYAPYDPYAFSLLPIRKIEVKGISGTAHIVPFDYNFNLMNLHPSHSMEDVYFESLCYDYLNSDLPTQACLHFKEFKNEPFWNAVVRFVEWVKDKNPEYLTYSEANSRRSFSSEKRFSKNKEK